MAMARVGKKLFGGGPDTTKIFKDIVEKFRENRSSSVEKIVKQRLLTIKEPVTGEKFSSRKSAAEFMEEAGINSSQYIIREAGKKKFTVHQRVPRIPLYEDMAEIARGLATGPDLEAKLLGKYREKWSLEPAIGTFDRLEEQAPGITEKLWYKAHELDAQAELRYRDTLEQLKPVLKGLTSNSSKNIDAWAVSQQKYGPESRSDGG
jgi:hypothetical protein